MENIEHQYKKPIYDPWEDLDPDPSVLKNAIKQMKEECYAIIKTQNILKQEDFYFEDSPQEQERIRRHKFLCWRIKDYEARLKAKERTGSYITESSKEGRFTEVDIERAKQVPINSLLTGRTIRRFGSRERTTCPLHNERTPSFTIYLDNNTYYCFGCNQGGDVIDLVMKLDNIDFVSAVKKLI